MTVFNKSIKHLKKHYSQYFVFEALVMLLTSTLVLPQIIRLYQWAMVQSGTPIIINTDLLKTNILSMSFLIRLSGIGLLVLLLMLEYIILIVMVDANRRNQPITMIGAIWVGIKHIPSMWWAGIIQLVSLGLIFVPFIMSTSRINAVNIPITIYEWLLGFKKLEPYWIVFALLWVYTHIHTLFVMYLMLIKKKSAKEALAESFRLVHKKQIRVFISWIPFLIFILFLWLFLSVIVQIVTQIIVSLEIYATIKYFMVYCISILSYTAILAIFPWIITYMICLYHKITDSQEVKNQGEKVIVELNYKPKFAKLPRWIKKFQRLTNLAMAIALLGILGVNYLVIRSVVKWDVKIVAHRGDSGYAPENTLASIQSAIDKQVDVVELDVMITLDGVLVIHHDETLSRTAGVDARISKLPYGVIKEYDIGSRISSEFAGEYIPTLNEALQFSKGKVYVLLDIKDQGNVSYLVPKVVKLIEDLDMVDAVSIQSFSTKVLKTVRKLNPDIKLGQILSSYTGDLGKLDVDFFTIRYHLLTSDFVKEANSLGREVWVWTVNSTVNLYEVFSYDIDAIITDYPERAQYVRNLTR